MSDLAEDVKALHAQVQEVTEDVEKFKAEIEKGLGVYTAPIMALEEALVELREFISNKVDKMRDRFSGIGKRLSKMEQHFQKIEDRLGNIEEHLAELSATLKEIADHTAPSDLK
jgi:archaellum component FlaC